MNNVKKRLPVSSDEVLKDIQYTIEETIECMEFLIGLQKSTEEYNRLIDRLLFGRIITNLHQTIDVLKRYTGLHLNDVEKASLERVTAIRNGLVHCYTNYEQIKNSAKIKTSFCQVNGRGPLLQTTDKLTGKKITQGNGFSDDQKIFFGSNYIFLTRDLLRLICRMILHVDQLSYKKQDHTFNMDYVFALSPAEDEPSLD